jgi:excisionase family DNA binding protein
MMLSTAANKLHGCLGEMMEDFYDYQKCAVLYVDDEEKSLQYFARAFDKKFRILCAAGAAEGYRLLQNHRSEIALLMTDQRMPGEKGVEFLQRARRLHPNAIRILTTAYSDFDAAIEAINSAGISQYVPKPWDIPQLETILRRACEFFMVRREHDRVIEATAQPNGMVVEEDTAFGNLLTPEQVARYLNVNKFTVYRLITQKEIPALKVGNQWRFKQEMIDTWLMAKSNLRKKNSN